MRLPEEGLTLVEQVIALAVVAILFVPLAGMAYSGLAGAAASRHSGDAVALANAQLAHAGSIPYQNLGFYEDQPGFVSSYQGQATVVIGTTTPTGTSPQVIPSQPEKVGAVTYTVTTYVVWTTADGPSQSYPEAYKRLYAVVTWSEGFGTERVTENTIVYPGGIGKYTGPGGDAPLGGNGSPANPTGLTATLPAWSGVGIDPAISEVDLTWNPPASTPGYYVVEWATASNVLPGANGSGTGTPGSNGSYQASPRQSGTATSYPVQGLSPATTYYFEVVAFSTSGNSWAVSNSQVSATTHAQTASTCSLAGVTVTGASSGNTGKTYESKSGAMSENLSVVVSSSGDCSDASVKVVASPLSGGTDPGSPYVLTDQGGQWTGTVASSGQTSWATGQHTFAVQLNGSTVNPPLAQSMVVCTWIAPGKRSSSQNQC